MGLGVRHRKRVQKHQVFASLSVIMGSQIACGLDLNSGISATSEYIEEPRLELGFGALGGLGAYRGNVSRGLEIKKPVPP